MSTLKNLMEQYNSNKSWHGYCAFYDMLFSESRHQVKHFFEIGISNGSSLFAWKDYFPTAQIYGIDIAIPDCVKGVDRIHFATTDQGSSSALQATIAQWNTPLFDCILDDGGHHVKQQRVSIETLWKHVAPGGYYIIEDLHTNIRYFHTNHPHMNASSTFIDETPTVHSKIIQCFEGNQTVFPFCNEIEHMFYYMNPNTKSLSCAFQKKR